MPCVHRLQVDRMSFTYQQTRVTVKPASHVLVMLCNLKEQHVQLGAQPQHVQVPDVMSRTRLAAATIGPSMIPWAQLVTSLLMVCPTRLCPTAAMDCMSCQRAHFPPELFMMPSLRRVVSRARFPLHWMKLPRKGAWSMMCIMWQQLLHRMTRWCSSSVATACEWTILHASSTVSAASSACASCKLCLRKRWSSVNCEMCRLS